MKKSTKDAYLEAIANAKDFEDVKKVTKDLWKETRNIDSTTDDRVDHREIRVALRDKQIELGGRDPHSRFVWNAEDIIITRRAGAPVVPEG